MWTLGLWLCSLAFGQAPPDPPKDPFKPDKQGLAMVVTPLADGVSRAGQGTAVRVTVVNQKKDTTAILRVREAAGPGLPPSIYERTIEMPKGSKREVLLPFETGNNYGERIVELETEDGRGLVRPFKLRTANPNDVTIAVIGDDAYGLTSLTTTWTGGVPGRSPRPTSYERAVFTGLIPVTALPDRSSGYESFDWVVWPKPDPTELDAEQWEALRYWVADGGHLLVMVTDSAPGVNQSPMAEMLPVQLSRVVDAPEVDALLTSMRLPATPAGTPVPIAVATEIDVPGRTTWTRAKDATGNVLWASGTYGLGTVHFLAVDPSLQPITGLGAAKTQWWRELLWLPGPTDYAWYSQSPGFYGHSSTAAAIESTTTGLYNSGLIQNDADVPGHLAAALDIGKTSFVDHYDTQTMDIYGTSATWEQNLRGRLAKIPGVEPLPILWLLAFAGGYLLLIGPIDWWVLRALKRQPLTWFTFPAYIVLFSGGALVMTSLQKGSQAAVVRIAVVDGLPGTKLYRGESYVSVFATRKTDLSLGAGFEHGDAGTLRYDSGAMWEPHFVSEAGAGKVSWRAETWTLAYGRTRWITEGKGRIRVEPQGDGQWKIVNELPIDILGARLCVGVDRFELPALKAGETKIIAAPSAQTQVWKYTEVDLNLQTMNPKMALDWAEAWQLDRPAFDGGTLDATWAYPSVIAVSEQPFEPLQLDGLQPVLREITVLRLPVERPISELNPSASNAPATISLGATVPMGSKVVIVGYGPNAYEKEAKLLGQTCSVDYDLYGYEVTPGQWLYSGSVNCNGSSKYLYDVRLQGVQP